MSRILTENERLRREYSVLQVLNLGVYNLIKELAGPEKLGDAQLPGEHPFVYGINDAARAALTDRLYEVIFTPDDYAKLRSQK